MADTFRVDVVYGMAIQRPEIYAFLAEYGFPKPPTKRQIIAKALFSFKGWKIIFHRIRWGVWPWEVRGA